MLPGSPCSVACATIVRRVLAAVALAATVSSAPAQGTCGAAGGAPPGPSASVCDYAAEAGGVRPPGPARGAGNPVDLATGNKYRFERDYAAPGPLPLVFARHYNSRNRHAGAFGVGWSHGLETRLLRGGGEALQLVQGDGRRIVFRPDPGRRGRWRTAHVTDGVIERVPDAVPALVEPPEPDRSGYAWRIPGERTLRFDGHGRLRSIARSGRLHLFTTPDDAGRLAYVTGTALPRIALRWIAHAHGPRVAALEVDDRELVAYRYDDVGQLASVRWPDGRERHYRYDDPHDPLRLTEVLDVDAPGALPRQLTHLRYDTQGRVVSVVGADEPALDIHWMPAARAGAPATVSVTDSLGRRATYRYAYDRRDHAVRWLDARGTPCARCPPAPRRHRYDPAGRWVGSDGPDGALDVEHDRIGRPRAAWHRDAQGRHLMWRVDYPGDDPVALPSRIEQPSVAPGRLHRIDIVRDDRGRVVRIDEHGFAPARGARGATRFEPIERSFGLGHVDASHAAFPGDDPLAGLARLAWVDGPLPGPSDRITLRAIGTWHDGRLVLAHPGIGDEVLRYRHDRVVQHASAGGTRTPIGPQSAAPWAGGGSIPGAFVGSARIDVLHDGAGEPRAVRRTDWQRGRVDLVEADPPAPAAPIPSDAPRIAADWRGQARRVVLADGSAWARGFDDFGRVVWIDAPGRPRAWARHDAADRLVEHHPGDGHVLHHERDAAGRLLSTVRIAPDGRRTVLGRYRWDGLLLLEAANDTVRIRYGYDTLGRTDRIEHVFADAPHAPLVTTWQRDLAGRIVAETLPGGVVVHYLHHGREVVALRVEGLAGPPQRVDAPALREPTRLLDAWSSPVSPGPKPAFAADRLLRAAGVEHHADPHLRRALKHRIADGARTAFVHQDWRLRTERGPDGRLRHWLWVDAQPVALVEDGRLMRIVSDARRAPVRLLDADGRIVWAAHYDRAGAARVDAAAAVTVPLRLPGQYADDETGWHHNHWRTYDPRAGRYLEPDPLGLQPSYTGRDSLYAYANGDPVGGADPWGLARITWFALTTGVDGRPLGRTQGFERARWSFIIEDIQPVELAGLGRSPPRTAGVDGLLFDPWGDFVRNRPDLAAAGGNALDAIAWRGVTGREVFAAFAAHYEPSLARIDRFVVDGFDDRRAGALALILMASPSERAQCVASVLGALPGIDLGPAQRRVTVAPAPPAAGTARSAFEAPRLLDCTPATTLPVRYAGDIERDRVERLQAAAELQESPSASIGENCASSQGCRSRTAIDVNGRLYWASYGRTQFTVTTFLAELVRTTAPDAGMDGDALRAAVGLNRPARLDGRETTVEAALALARDRVDATYRAFAALRSEFGRGVPIARAREIWDTLPAARRDAFTRQTGLGVTGFVDLLGYLATGVGGRTEEEGRHAIAASAAATVRFVPAGSDTAVGFDSWLVELFGSRDPYDHLSRAFLRDNLRRVLAAPGLAGAFDNPEPPDTDAWRTRQQAIELDLARRVAVLHNSGRLDLATQPDLERWLGSNPQHWVAGYVRQFVADDARGNWDALRCSTALHGPQGVQFTALTALPAPRRPRPR